MYVHHIDIMMTRMVWTFRVLFPDLFMYTARTPSKIYNSGATGTVTVRNEAPQTKYVLQATDAL